MVNYSTKRTALFKEANQLAAFYDANVSIIIISDSGKVHAYASQSTTHEIMYDLYQERKGVNIWEPYVEKLQDELQTLKDENESLRNELRLWSGDRESLNALSNLEADNLIKEMKGAIDLIQVRQNHVLEGEIVKTQRKLNNSANINKDLMIEYNSRQENAAVVVVAPYPNIPGYAMW